MSFEDEVKISNLLVEHHTIFQTFWKIGTPIFTDKIPTAAVGFDSLGDVLYMIINPEFWESLDINNKLFVIAHECLHVVLNHGKRGKHYKNQKLVNIAQDIVINEMLVSGFSFQQQSIQNWEQLCFVETLFDRETIISEKIHKKGSFKYYFDLLDTNEHSEDTETLDQHSNAENLDSEIQDLIDEMAENSTEASEVLKEEADNNLSKEEKKEFSQEIINEIKEAESSGAGTIPMGQYIRIKIDKVKKNKKWESIVKNHIKSIVKMHFVDKPSWITRGRRNACLDEDLFAQGEWETQVPEKQKYKLVFFLDASGSCYSHAERFVKMLQSIPEEIFDIEAYSFDNYLYPIDIKTGKIQGCGGTYFHILDDHIRKMTKKSKHPDAVFVLSDGDGNHFSPEKPKLWHWILTPWNHTTYIPKESPKHNMKDFI
jgi:predicted metal-dependent peptidase